MNALILLRDFQESQIEFWLPIKGFAGYDVSSFGRVRSWVKRERILGTRYGQRRGRALSPFIMQLTTHRQGYLEATLYLGGNKRKIKKVHRLVAGAFIPNTNNKPTVNHKTGIKPDNRLDNLEWQSKSEQIRHALATGLMVPVGKYQPRISEAIRQEVRLLASRGLPRTVISQRFGISRPSVATMIKEG